MQNWGTERALSLCQEQQVITRFDKPPRRFEQPLYGGQVEGLLHSQVRQAALSGALHHQLACLLCVREFLACRE
jgi:hypothetical protein